MSSFAGGSLGNFKDLIPQAPKKRRHRWIPAKGLRGFWSKLRGIKSFTCACGAHLHLTKKGRFYFVTLASGKDPGRRLDRRTPMPSCTRGGAR